jgi:hypothetical protein
MGLALYARDGISQIAGSGHLFAISGGYGIISG